jgi:hypothetical protein
MPIVGYYSHMMPQIYPGALLHFDGTDETAVFIDQQGHRWVVGAGTPVLDSAQSVFGGASLRLTGTDDYVKHSGRNTDLDFRTGDFTVAMWVRFNTITGIDNKHLYDNTPDGSFDPAYFRIVHARSGGLDRCITVATIAGVIVNSTTLVDIEDQWYHVALTRASGTMRLFINGVLEGSAADSTDFFSDTDRPTVGARGFNPTAPAFDGWIDELIAVNGKALWTSTFSVPTAPHSLIPRP